MLELAQMQEEFSAALAVPRGVEAVPACLRAADDAGTTRRFALYRNNIRLARMNAVTGAYPVIASIVGEEFMTGLAREYAIAHDSNSGDLNEYGASFGEFLVQFAPAQSLPYLPDVARLEWQAHLAYYAADAQALDVARLAQVPQDQWRQLCFTLHPAMHLARHEWPVARIWQVSQPAYAGEMGVDLTPGEYHALVYRPQFDVVVAAISNGEFAFLSALAAQLTFESALAAACAAQADFDPAAALQAAVQRGLLSDFTLEEFPS